MATLSLLASVGVAQPPALPIPSSSPTVATAGTQLPGEPVDFGSILRLAATTNLDIAQARLVVEQAQARRQRALSQALPNLGLGTTWISHDGKTQQQNGNIQTFNRDSLFVGGGPSLTLNLSDALYGPLAARQAVSATEAGARRVTNDTLLAVGDAYLQVLRARRRLARVDDTLELLLAERPSEMRARSKGLLPLLRDSVELGGKEAFQSDLARVQVEVSRRQEERAAAFQELRFAAAETARLVRLDPGMPLWPVEDYRGPIPLPGDELAAQSLEALVSTALMARPELAENQALVQATLALLRAAKARPYLPNVEMDMSYGGFGGSPIRDTSRRFDDPQNGPVDFPLTPSGEIHRFGPRTDVTVSLVWKLNGLGFGNAAERREQTALHDQAQVRLLQTRDRVVAQVVQALDAVQRSQERMRITRAALFDDKGEPVGAAFRSIRLNFDRIRGGEGRPFEVLDSIRGFSDILEAYGQAVTDLERATLRLRNAVGSP